MKLKTQVSDEQTRQIALEFAMGESIRNLEARFGYNRVVIRRILDTPQSKAIIDETQGKTHRAAVALLRRRLCELVDKTVKVIEDQLDKGNLNAVQYVYKALGVETKGDDKPAQQQAIQVILPGAKSVKDVTNE